MSTIMQHGGTSAFGRLDYFAPAWGVEDAGPSVQRAVSLPSLVPQGASYDERVQPRLKPECSVNVLEKFARTSGPAGGFGARLCLGMPQAALGEGRNHKREAREVALVRALGRGTGEEEVKKSSHETLMSHLKSRSARLEAESTKEFLATYRGASRNDSSTASSVKLDEQLNGLIARMERRTEELRLRNDELKPAMIAAENKLNNADAPHSEQVSHSVEASDGGFMGRSKRRLDESKRAMEQEAAKEAAQAELNKLKRLMQSDLVELRDIRMLLQEYRKARLDKLQESLRCPKDGSRLRATIREMIRHGAQRVIQKLETSGPAALEPWMREVMVNMCHVELRLEDLDVRLLVLRRDVVAPVRNEMQSVLSYTYEERFQQLCDKTWHSLQNFRAANDMLGLRPCQVGIGLIESLSLSCAAPPESFRVDDMFSCLPPIAPPSTIQFTESFTVLPDLGKQPMKLEGQQTTAAARTPVFAVMEMRALDAEAAALRRLLQDMRDNVASVTSNRMRQAETSGADPQELAEWGRAVLTIMVSQDFAKTTMKAMLKSAERSSRSM